MAKKKARAEAPPVAADEAHDRMTQPVDSEEPPRLSFPVVGIGASAGGLEAAIELLEGMRPQMGMAFVFVQHLSPDRESMIAEILSKHTGMKVHEVGDRMPVEINHVYVIRPGHTLTIKDGLLHLGERLEKPGNNRPVDDFFKSLAEEQRERAIAIILSGMGSNGTAGAQAVKAVGGLCIAQDPESAKFPSMPRHLIDAGYADYILRPPDMPDVLLGYAGHPYTAGRIDAEGILRREQQHLREIFAVLRTRTKQDFSGYKKPTVLRRVQRRMGLSHLTKMGDYAKLLRQSPTEVSALADDLLIHVTGFFRDGQAWEALRERVIVPLVAAREPGASVRCWVTACSSGEEAYTMAMLLVEEADRTGKMLDIKVFATDMAERSLQNARSGVYPGGIEAEIIPERLERFFLREDSVYRVRQDLRERVVFAPQNLLQDPPFSRLDIASCRNLLIYLEPPVQQRVLSLLHFGLREGGALFLGTSETVIGPEELFEPIDKKARIFRRVGPTRHEAAQFPLPHAMIPPATLLLERARLEGRAGPAPSLAQLTNKALLANHTPAAVTVDRDQRIVYFHGNTDRYLAQPRGTATRDLLSMARETVRGAVRTALQRAITEGGAQTVLDGWLETEPGKRSRIAITASQLDARSAPDYYIISFEERGEVQPALPPAEGADFHGDRHELEEELRRVRDELQSTIEELQTSKEEMKASHEEVMSMNEELQSSNEELETSKEEMQSLNEELHTVNSQLQSKMEESQATSNDLASLLTSTDIAVLFLDTRFRIRRYTPAVKSLMDMISTDVGRPINDLAKKFTDPDLMADAELVLERLQPIDREVPAEGGRWYTRKVLPYRTADNRIDGVVVTLVDITERRRVDQMLAERARLLDLSNDAIVIRDLKGLIVYWSRGAAALYGWSAEEAVGRNLDELLQTRSDVTPEELRRKLNEENRYTGEVSQVTRDGRRITGTCRWALDRDNQGRPNAILTTTSDITERKRSEEALRENLSRFRAVADLVPDLLWSTDDRGRTDWFNQRWMQYTGQSSADARDSHWLDVIHPEDSRRFSTEFQDAIGGGGPLRSECRFRGADGKFRWFLVQAQPSPDGNLGTTRWFVAATDVDQQRRTLEALQDSEERHRLVVNDVEEYAIFMLDVDGRVSTWNAGIERVLGYQPDEIIGQPMSLIFTPEDRAAGEDQNELRTALTHGRATDERWHVRKDGTRFWASGVLTAIRDASGKPRGFSKVMRDATEQRRAEEAGSRLAAFIESSNDAVIAFTLEGRVVSWNPAASRMFGYSVAEATDMELESMVPEDLRDEQREMFATLARGESVVQLETTRLTKSGRAREVSITASPAGDMNGTPLAAAIIQDITARKRAEEALYDAKSTAEAANRMKDEFLATLSHELRTPLASILLWTKMLQSRESDPAKLHDGLSAIRKSAESQKELIEDLLDTSRINAGKLRLQMRETDLPALVREAVDAILPAAQAKGVGLHADLAADAGTVLADPDRLRQVVWNLLTNSVKFTPPDGQVTVGLWRREKGIEIRVTDTGEGMTAEFLPHAFEPFRQGDASISRRHGGVGLGLAICKQLVELHGGTIRTESDGPGKGSTFVVQLPLPGLKKRKAHGKASDGPAPSPAENGGLTKIRVLLIEQDAGIRKGLSVSLQLAGAEVIAVDTAKAGLAAYSKSRPDVILSDIHLADTDGYTFLREVRALEASGGWEPVPAVALFSPARETDLSRASDAGFVRHVSKPVDTTDLLAALTEALNGDPAR